MKHCAATLRGSGGIRPKGGDAETVGRACEPYGHRTQSDFPQPPGGIPLMTIDDQKLVEQCEAGIKTLVGVDEWVRANPQATGSSGEALLRESNRSPVPCARKPPPPRGKCAWACSARASPESPTSSRRWRRMPTARCLRHSATNPPISFRTSTGGRQGVHGPRHALHPDAERRPGHVSRETAPAVRIGYRQNPDEYLLRRLPPPHPARRGRPRRRVDALAKKAKGEPWRASFSEDDMIDLKEYVTRNFRATAVVQRLEHLYWPKAIHAAGRSHPKIAPRCSKSCGTRPNRLRRSTCA